MAVKNILITGGSGFIGKNLLELFASRYNILAPSSAELNLLDANKTKDFFSSHNFDVVVHAAAAGVSRAQKQADDIYSRNVEMFNNLLANRQSFAKLINLGSGAEYDKSRELIKVKEEDFGQSQPKDDYGRAKYFIAEQIGQLESMVDLRCFGVFGKYEDYTTRFISNGICRALAGLPIVLNQNRFFDYVYADDLAEIIAYYLDNETSQKFYNISSPQPVELLRLAEIIKTATASSEEIKVKMPGLAPEYSGDNSLLMKELKDFKFTPIEKAIAEMVAWYKKNWLTINIERLNFDA